MPLMVNIFKITNRQSIGITLAGMPRMAVFALFINPVWKEMVRQITISMRPRSHAATIAFLQAVTLSIYLLAQPSRLKGFMLISRRVLVGAAVLAAAPSALSSANDMGAA
jgi:hypothetical protein